MWNATDGKKLFYCDGISDNMEESILCVNISKDNSRLVASAANGRIAVSNCLYIRIVFIIIVG